MKAAEAENLQLVKHLILNGKANPNTIDSIGMNAGQMEYYFVQMFLFDKCHT